MAETLTTTPAILLASGSPRRRELLGQLAVTFTVAAADIDESITSGETPRVYVKRMAIEKALAGYQRSNDTLPVLGADTIVVRDGEILGKPETRQQAENMLQKLSDRTHEVYSAVALVLGQEEVFETLNITAVTFAAMSSDWIENYCRGEEPMDKAGAYAVQGGAGQFIRCIQGSYSGVMGLPLYETAKLLRDAGVLK